MHQLSYHKSAINPMKPTFSNGFPMIVPMKCIHMHPTNFQLLGPCNWDEHPKWWARNATKGHGDLLQGGTAESSKVNYASRGNQWFLFLNLIKPLYQ